MKTLSRPKKTARGFRFVEFKDGYGIPCSLQESSAVGEPCVWLGTDDAKPQVLHGDARRLGVKTDATCGWVPYPIPKEVLLSTRMYLDRKKVKALVHHLQKWLATGRF